MQKETVLVIGASGTVGTELVRLLRARGHRVRAATSRAPRDVDDVQLNLISGEGVRQAFEGVDRAFLLSPPGYADQHALLSPLIQEAKRRGLKKVVLMTAIGANAVEASPFRRAEVELEKSGLTYNILRPNWFMQNFHTFWLSGIRERGKILLPVGQAKGSFIDSRDIAAVAAELLTTSRFDNQAIDITGPEDLDHDEVAAILSRVTGKTIGYEEVSPAEMRRGLLGAGLPADYAEFLLLILGAFREGYSAGVRPTVREILGRAPRNFQQYAQDHQKAWL